jgi:F-type H+-transporting ATPase subunit delta
LLEVLARNKRLQLLPEISKQYEMLRAQAEKSLEVEVISAFALEESERQRLVETLKKRFEREIQLTSRVDEQLMGGMVIRAGDTVIDGSVRGKLEKLAETLQRA